jgi:hypothetical protein
MYDPVKVCARSRKNGGCDCDDVMMKERKGLSLKELLYRPSSAWE